MIEEKILNKDPQEILSKVKVPPARFQERLQEVAAPYRELMAYYRCAMMEVETKFNVLSEELSLEYDRNPIETIKSRLKSFESISGKLQRLGLPPTIESIENNLFDVAGVRVVCAFPNDIYKIEKAFVSQDDVFLIEENPIFLHDEKKMMTVEVQLRTISMDWWASLEHKIRYKKDIDNTPELAKELKFCAEGAAELDRRMQSIQSNLLQR